MKRAGLALAWAAAVLLTPSAARAQAERDWESSVFAALRARLAVTPAPPVPAASPAPPDPDARVRALFSHVLIAGASVSAGFRAESPGRRVAERFGAGGSVVSVAAPGAAAASQVPRLTDARLAAASVVVGVDLFFWDARRDCAPGLAAMDDLFRRLAVRGTPAIVGTVPGGGDCGAALNAKLARACSPARDCFLLDLAALYAKAAADGADLDGRHLTLRELQPDGLHLSDAGSELLARALLAAARGSPAPAN